MRTLTLILGLVLTTIAANGLACSAHPPEVSHSEWAWMQKQRDPKTNKVETVSGDFFNNSPRPQSQPAPSSGDRPIRYVK